MTLTAKNVQDRYHHVLLVKEVCIFTTQNALRFVLNQLCRVEMHVLIVMPLVLNALQLLINALYVHKDFTFMNPNAKNVLMDGLEMMKLETVKRIQIQQQLWMDLLFHFLSWFATLSYFWLLLEVNARIEVHKLLETSLPCGRLLNQ